MIQFFLSIYDKLIKRRWLVIAVLFLCLAGCLIMTSRMHYKEDIADFLPQNKQSEKYSSVYNNLSGQNKIILTFSQNGAKSIDSLIDAMEEFGSCWKAADSLNVIKDMQVQIDESQMMEIIEFIWENYPYFLTEEDYQRMDSLLSTPGYIPRKMENNKHLLMLPTGGIITQNLRYDPLQLFSPVTQRLQSFNIGDQYQVVNGYIFNKKGDKGLIIFSSPYGISESKQNEHLENLVDTVIKKTEAKYSGLKISAVGAPFIAVSNALQIKKDSLFSVSLSVILIFAILIYSFRRFNDLFWIGSSILFGWLFALGCIAVFKSSISIIVIGIGSIIIGIAVNYPLHFLDHLKHAPSRRIALKEMIKPLLIGNITTVSAFLCLLFLDAEAMRDLGLFGSFTLIGTIIFVLVFLPVMASQSKTNKSYFHFNLDRLLAFSDNRRKRLLIPILIITIIFFYFSLNTSFDSNIQHINYMTDQQRSDFNMLSASIQRNDSIKNIYAVAEGENLQQALRQNENLLEKLKGQNQIIHIKGINNFIPSDSRQKERIDRWESFWKSHENVAKDIAQESSRLGFSKNAFSPFIESITTSHNVQKADYFDPLIRFVGKNFIAQDGNTVRIVNYVQTPASKSEVLKKTINSTMSSGCFAFDTDDVSNQLVSILSDNFNYIGFVCGFVVFFFLWISFGRLELGLLSFLPLAVSWIWILGIMQIFGIQFNIVNIILATFIFGQGDDYTIFITEGLMQEYAYGKKTLTSYKNSVALSAVIMLIGIGTLIFAKHPAMRSLAEVAIIGMLTVVVMAYYLPPLVFKWITTSKGALRQVPLTLQRISYSLFSVLFFLTGTYLVMMPLTFMLFHIGKVTENKRICYHRILKSISAFVVKHIPGVKVSFNNEIGEKFEKPAVIICNHHSHLDLMCVMALTPKLVILTNDWVWNNPFYGTIIKHAEFYPVSDGIDINLERLQSLIRRGYSVVIFPEGTRSEDCSILRFHQGAFYIAEKLQLDILPLFIHGAGHVLPKKDFMLRRGSIYLEIGERMTADNVISGGGCKKLTSHFNQLYKAHYADICDRCENAGYFIPYILYKYKYKGQDAEHRCRKVLRNIKFFSGYIDRDFQNVKTIRVLNSGQGEFAWLLALVHKNIDVFAFEHDEDLHLLASNCAGIPDNLHFVHQINDEQLLNSPAADETIDAISLTRNI